MKKLAPISKESTVLIACTRVNTHTKYGFPFREPPKGLHTERGDYLPTDSTLLLRLLDYKGFYYTGGSTTLLLSSEVADELSARDAGLLVLCADHFVVSASLRESLFIGKSCLHGVFLRECLQ